MKAELKQQNNIQHRPKQFLQGSHIVFVFWFIYLFSFFFLSFIEK